MEIGLHGRLPMRRPELSLVYYFLVVCVATFRVLPNVRYRILSSISMWISRSHHHLRTDNWGLQQCDVRCISSKIVHHVWWWTNVPDHESLCRLSVLTDQLKARAEVKNQDSYFTFTVKCHILCVCLNQSGMEWDG